MIRNQKNRKATGITLYTRHGVHRKSTQRLQFTHHHHQNAVRHHHHHANKITDGPLHTIGDKLALPSPIRLPYYAFWYQIISQFILQFNFHNRCGTVDVPNC